MPNSSRSWLPIAVWAVGAVAYLAAIMSRTSLSATAGVASERFDLTSEHLAAFGLLQLIVYAGAQIPVGMLIDRLGARTVLLAGLVLIAASQLMIGFGETFSTLLAARALAGLGDAMVFPSAVRLTAVSLRPAWISTGTQMVGVVGNFGMLVTATPLLWMVDMVGWPPAYLILAAVTGVIALCSGVVLVLMGPDATRTASNESLGDVLRGTGRAMKHPGTWLAFFTHFSTNLAFVAFIVTWGALFLQYGAEIGTGGASVYLSAIPIIGMIAGPVVGRLVSTMPEWRRIIIVWSVIGQLVAWGAVLLWPVPTPFPLLVLLAVATAIGGPASLIAFELSRQFVPASLAARANGIVNTGGFTGALLAIGSTGLLLSIQGAHAPGDYSMEMFRIAFLPMLGMMTAGLIAFIVLSRRMRRREP
ncbi:MFS transporter [Microbacterium amylolyticum]|uniref:MFS family permease n=1 Tax=Microbacterium amylolyticum TaxID=936337 RepID=A0ABS4ZGL3_9MICO|nr:MFS transporter [Microbacterium amylolyticum]MBP2436424.1 MFS family permease [Microbacterium amylolyticum]